MIKLNNIKYLVTVFCISLYLTGCVSSSYNYRKTPVEVRHHRYHLYDLNKTNLSALNF